MSQNPNPQHRNINLSAIGDDIPSLVDGATSDEFGDFESHQAITRLNMEQQSAAQTLDERGQDMSARKNYARNIFLLLLVWLTMVFGVVIGSGYEKCPIHLSDAVLIALISGVSISVVGLFAIVANYLFPRP